MKRIVYILILLGLQLTTARIAGAVKRSTLRTGDLIFQNLDCGPMCTAIEAVTEGYHGRDFSHMGMIYLDEQGRVFVLESIGKDVQQTALDTFLQRSTHPHLIARLRNKSRHLVPAAVQFCRQQLGTPYDAYFLYDNGAYYCSELIYDAFLTANKGKPLFTLYPMTYKDPASGTFYPVWTDYFKSLQTEIPEGLPGCNPGGMSRSGQLRILGDLDR